MLATERADRTATSKQAITAYHLEWHSIRFGALDHLTYLDSYGYDVLASHCIMVSSTEPAIRKTYEFAHSIYDSIINTDGDPLSGLGCWTFGKNFGYTYIPQSSIEDVTIFHLWSQQVKDT